MKPLSVVGFILGVMALTLPAQAADAPNVVVSIKPLHSLVANVMKGVGTPTLLVKGGSSPHTYSLKPSDAEALQKADLIFWDGPSLEFFLAGPLETLGSDAQIVALQDAPGLMTLTPREGGAFEPEAEAPGEAGHEETIDPHIWLDPENAKDMVMAINDALDKADPTNATTYDHNAAETLASLDDLSAEIQSTLEPVHDGNFIVFHDAYQYFEKRYALEAAGSVTISPDQQPGAKRLAEIQQKLKSFDTACVFTEPEFTPAFVSVVTEGTNAKSGVLDPLGADIPDGPDLYFTLMRDLANNLADCLEAKS